MQIERQLAEVDRPGDEEVGLLRLGEQEQVGDVAAHPVELVGDDRDGLGPFDRVVAEHLEVAAGDRDRRPQLVGDVVEEATLRREALLEAARPCR